MQRLVNASIAALRNAASNQGKRSNRPPIPSQSHDDHVSVASSRSYASMDTSLHDNIVNARNAEPQRSPESEKRSASTGRLNFYRPPGFPPPPSSPPAARHLEKGGHRHRPASSSSEESYNRIRERYSHY